MQVDAEWARVGQVRADDLEKTLPERYRVEINRILIPFGKNVCTGTAPRCSTCRAASATRSRTCRRRRKSSARWRS